MIIYRNIINHFVFLFDNNRQIERKSELILYSDDIRPTISG